MKFEYKITLLYTFVGLIWIIFSDKILELFVHNVDSLTHAQSIKGSIYILITAMLLFYLVRQYVKNQNRTEQLLNESNEKYKAIYDKAPIAFQILDSDGRFVKVNPAWLKTLGYAADEVYGKNFRDFLHPESKKIFDRQFPEFKQKGNVKIIFQIQKKNGDYIYVIFDGNAVYEPSGRFKQSYCTFADITDDYIATKQLSLSEKRYKSLFHENKSIMLLVDTKTDEIVDANESALKFYGYNLEDIKRMNISDINILSKEEIDSEKKAAEKENRDYYHFKHKLYNGEIRDVQVYSGKIIVQNKMLNYSITHDITQQIKIARDLVLAKEKAEESDRLKSAFLANMSHEIRTPMNGILGFVNLLEEPHLNANLHEKYLKLVKNSGERLLNTINDIIEISKIEAGQTTIYNSSVNLLNFMKYLFDFFRPEAKKKGLNFNLVVNNCPKNVEIITDKNKLESILTNLIKNALKFTKQGHVEFGCIAKNNSFHLYVKDTGSGIPKEKINSIFNRFVQADNTTTKPYEGSGLGLSIAQAYTKMLCGNISVESEVGKGSIFNVEIPQNLH